MLGAEKGGKPAIIPPPHDEDHVFVASVGVFIKQMGKGSNAYMSISGDDNKATIIQRGGDGGNGATCDGGHYAYQDIIGDWNRIFADQRGTGHYVEQLISGDFNLVTSMQKGNGSESRINLIGSDNEIGVDQKGKGNISDIQIIGDSNGNFSLLDEYGVKITQEGRGNISYLDIMGNYNFVSVHQGGGASSDIRQTGSWNSATVIQASIDEH